MVSTSYLATIAVSFTAPFVLFGCGDNNEYDAAYQQSIELYGTYTQKFIEAGRSSRIRKSVKNACANVDDSFKREHQIWERRFEGRKKEKSEDQIKQAKAKTAEQFLKVERDFLKARDWCFEIGSRIRNKHSTDVVDSQRDQPAPDQPATESSLNPSGPVAQPTSTNPSKKKQNPLQMNPGTPRTTSTTESNPPVTPK